MKVSIKIHRTMVSTINKYGSNGKVMHVKTPANDTAIDSYDINGNELTTASLYEEVKLKYVSKRLTENELKQNSLKNISDRITIVYNANVQKGDDFLTFDNVLHSIEDVLEVGKIEDKYILQELLVRRA